MTDNPAVALTGKDGPLVWVDCEMTGLDHKNDKIIEIAVLITNGNLELVDEGIRYVIKTEKKYLDGMDKWCVKTHGESGLTEEVLGAQESIQEVEAKVLAYVKRWVASPRTAILAGSSVHVDRQFLCEQMPSLVEYLHYRICDCSTIKELAYRWYDPLQPRERTVNHRALDDIKGSIQELSYFRKHIFRTREEVASRQS
ncbi:ribonuclease H-like protein [Cylindrobasidium torrendii FP15055 ss-10]|uniref:Ribonuclease H-like protein n=1 Tax=Cylindrobasidium torrendii FP15055 ss-10 TaxID=1314674 RepID=A0A0D7BC22_9AGAR|nr:ribonuclease H-like protein [Cylindrobasidium torrendii FP15055 ss-10]